MTGFTPMYLRKMYAQDPHFSDVKIVYSAYNTEIDEVLAGDVLSKLSFDDVTEKDASEMKEPSVLNMNKLAMRYSDGIVYGSETLNDDLSSYIDKSDKPVLTYQDEETVVEAHQEFYNNVLEVETVLAD